MNAGMWTDPVRRVCCAALPIAVSDLDGAVGELRRLSAETGHGADVHLCNAYTLALADRDPKYRSMLARASLNLTDGAPVVWVNQLRHRNLPSHRVLGTDLMLETMSRGQAFGLRHYLLGAAPGTLAALSTALCSRCPDVEIVGTESPPFRELTEPECEEQLGRVRESRAEIVWVGLGTPKQDWHAAWLASQAPVVAVAVGAAFDFVAGTKTQAPTWMRSSGLEWLYRLASEPRRLWRRYLFGNARFLYAAILQRRRR
jgi:N-acetylglucosaminyldiphosphoundecaprenol N-acetyl-beta-D-mannosaminyltransferase